MKRLFIPFTVLAIILIACAPKATGTSQLSPTPMVSEQATAQPASPPTEQIPPTANAKPRGKNPQPAATSTSPDFIATEILGRPTNTSITVNVVPAVPNESTSLAKPPPSWLSLPARLPEGLGGHSFVFFIRERKSLVPRYGHWIRPWDHRQLPQAGKPFPMQSSSLASERSQPPQ